MQGRDLVVFANAALLLGDLFVPPLNAIIHTRGEFAHGCVRVTEQARWEFWATTVLYMSYLYSPYDIVEILSLPDDCPPFEGWLR